MWNLSKAKGNEGPPSLEDMESLLEIIFSRKKEARESADGFETAGGSCSAGVDECRLDLIVVQTCLHGAGMHAAMHT